MLRCVGLGGEVVKTADLFCRVIDNFGDIGVCWRLARQLQHQQGYRVRLWVDDLVSFAAICPQLQPHLPQQQLDSIAIGQWLEPWPEVEPADLVIEAFACELPEAFIQRMRARPQPPCWLNLEYLSAESWVEGCHGLNSPQQGLNKQFFFPGFSAKTGGLLCEAGLVAKRQCFQADAVAQAEFWASLQLAPPQADELCISLFSYEQAGLAPWLELLASSNTPIRLLIPSGRVLTSVADWLNAPLETSLQRGNLSLHRLPMTNQQQFDWLLWACDFNLVRGEDSLVRAVWAGRALTWHIYPQSEGAHWPKLEAFLAHYQQQLPLELAAAVMPWWRAWNQQQDLAATWPAFYQSLSAVSAYHEAWIVRLLQQGDLASNLAKFHQARV